MIKDASIKCTCICLKMCVLNKHISSSVCTYIMLWFVLASITKKGEIEREIGLHLFLIDFGGLIAQHK
jgi:hypothetical protein